MTLNMTIPKTQNPGGTGLFNPTRGGGGGLFNPTGGRGGEESFTTLARDFNVVL